MLPPKGLAAYGERQAGKLVQTVDCDAFGNRIMYQLQAQHKGERDQLLQLLLLAMPLCSCGFLRRVALPCSLVCTLDLAFNYRDLAHCHPATAYIWARHHWYSIELTGFLPLLTFSKPLSRTQSH